MTGSPVSLKALSFNKLSLKGQRGLVLLEAGLVLTSVSVSPIHYPVTTQSRPLATGISLMGTLIMTA
jgi:hypothetical protein